MKDSAGQKLAWRSTSRPSRTAVSGEPADQGRGKGAPMLGTLRFAPPWTVEETEAGWS